MGKLGETYPWRTTQWSPQYQKTGTLEMRQAHRLEAAGGGGGEGGWTWTDIKGGGTGPAALSTADMAGVTGTEEVAGLWEGWAGAGGSET